ncbi:MAG TPA: hypothetical protein VMT89_04165, partial [Candidatus Acidoferrales bacterium]|nr:hypothetical protein [Candidatus Acidoferrales bacterium]
DAAAAARSLRLSEPLARAAVGYGGGFRGFNFGVYDPLLVALLRDALDRLPARDSYLRAQVLARTALALYDTPGSMTQRESLSRDAVEMAARVGDVATQIGTLYIRHWAIWAPENLEARRSTAEAIVGLAQHSGNAEMELQGRRFRAVDSLEAGDIATFNEDVAACGEVSERLRQPYYTWYVSGFRALRAFLDGDFAGSERFTMDAMRVGQRAQSQNVDQAVGAQLASLRREQGRLAEVEPVFRSLVAQLPTVPSWRCGLAYLLVETGQIDEARVVFDELAANEFAGVARDTFWLVAMNVLSDVCAVLGNIERAAVLYRLIEPFAERVAVNVVGTCMSSMARCLGRLAATTRRFDEAIGHFDTALATETRLKAHPLVAHTQHQYADALLARGRSSDVTRATALLEPALQQFERLGMPTFAAMAATSLKRARRLKRRN